jgi:hypothetical protein
MNGYEIENSIFSLFLFLSGIYSAISEESWIFNICGLKKTKEKREKCIIRNTMSSKRNKGLSAE